MAVIACEGVPLSLAFKRCSLMKQALQKCGNKDKS